MLHDSIKEQALELFSILLSGLQLLPERGSYTYLSDDSSGENTYNVGASAALHRNAVLICCSRYSADLGPSVSALM